ncbi:MAG TPA: glycogen synthase [Spirochaetes bacterium]|nr:glycogen synthase [Spirochaetota bacterium]
MYSPVTGHYNYYTGRELRASKLQTVVTYTDRIKLLKLETVDNPAEYLHEFLRDSFFRLYKISNTGDFKHNFAFQKIVSHSSSFDRFSSFILDHLIPLFNDRDIRFLGLGMKRALFHIYKTGICPGDVLKRYIDLMSHHENPGLKKLGRSLKEHNRKGPLVFISAEAEPFSKIGGLANVVYELPRKLAELGEEVCVITPLYKNGDEESCEKMKKAVKKYGIRYTGTNVKFKILDREYEVGLHQGVVNGINYYLLDHDEFFDGLYWGYTSEEKLKRRIAFARSCAEVITSVGLNPLFTFTNDAFTGIFNAVVRGDQVYRSSPVFRRTSFLHIIHNNGWKYFDTYNRYVNDLDLFSLFNLPSWQAENFCDPSDAGRINCMAAGARFSDRVITVSPSYARQIETGCDGLEHEMNDVIGINNAIGRDFTRRIKQRFKKSGFVEACYSGLLDRVRKDSKLLEKIEARYPEILQGARSCESIKNKVKRETLTRARNKMLLQVRHGFTVDPDKIIFTMIHRIVEQKGFQLLLKASEGIFKNLDFQGIIGGPIPTRDQKCEEIAHGLTLLGNYYTDCVHVNIGFLDVSIPLLCSDVFLMPSLYEPGGIAQIEAFACGCLVVARATGGLIDTVRPISIKGEAVEGNGFLFEDFTPGSFYDAMLRCSSFFKQADEKMLFKARARARKAVFYWDRPAGKYITEIYNIKEIIS